MTVAVVGPVKMGLGTTGTILCPAVLTVNLLGQTTSSWATATIVKIAASIKTDSDGYTMVLSMTSNANAIVAGNYLGGCLSGAGAVATNDVVCFYGKGVAGINSSAAGIYLTAATPYSKPVKNFLTATAVTGAVAITAAKWNMVLSGTNCLSATPVVGGIPACKADKL